MATKKTYVVKAIGIIVNLQGGFSRQLGNGAVIPDDVDPDQLEHLLEQDLVEEGEGSGMPDLRAGDGSRVTEADRDDEDDDEPGTARARKTAAAKP